MGVDGFARGVASEGAVMRSSHEGGQDGRGRGGGGGWRGLGEPTLSGSPNF